MPINAVLYVYPNYELCQACERSRRLVANDRENFFQCLKSHKKFDNRFCQFRKVRGKIATTLNQDENIYLNHKLNLLEERKNQNQTSTVNS